MKALFQGTGQALNTLKKIKQVRNHTSVEGENFSEATTPLGPLHLIL